jgi:hypothetical protein
VIPDPASGRLLRAYAIAAWAACAVASCDRPAARAASPGAKIVGGGLVIAPAARPSPSGLPSPAG